VIETQMSALAMTLMRLGFLLLLWAFVYFVVRVLKSDLYGTRMSAAAQARSSAVVAPEVVDPMHLGSKRPVRLVVVEGPLTGTSIPLASSAILIGRSPSCTLVLDDDYSSSRHARIFPQGENWLVEDLGSTNGTFVNGERVHQPVRVTAGESVRVGQSTIELQRWNTFLGPL